MARRRNSEVLWSMMTRVKCPHGMSGRRSSACNGSVPSGRRRGSTTLSPTRARVYLVIAAVAPGLAFGVFVEVGNAAAAVSAGAVVPSLLVAAVASLLAGLCLIELVTSQKPCPDSLYSCLYQWAGEAAAFTVGWLSLLHQGAAVAAVARLQSATIDSLAGGALATLWQQALGSPWDPLALALGLAAALAAAAPLGKALTSGRDSSWLGGVLIAVSAAAALFFVTMGSVGATAPPGNSWSLAMLMFSDSAPTGLLSGAALCMYAFIGPHSAVQRAPDSPQPARDLPLAVGVSTALTFLLTFAMAVVATLQSRHDTARPLAAMLASCSTDWAGTVMAAATIVGLATLALYGLFPLGGAVRSLAADGLLFRSLARVSERTGTPVGSILASGVLASVAALVGHIPRLLGLMAAGPLVLNTIVCFAVLVTRYHPPSRTLYGLLSAGVEKKTSKVQESSRTVSEDASSELSSSSDDDDDEDIDSIVRDYKERLRVAALTDMDGGVLKDPTSVTARRADLAVMGLLVTLVLLATTMEVGSRTVASASHLGCAIVSTVSAVAVGALLVVLSRLPQGTGMGTGYTFRVPMVPWLPAIGAFLNVCLLVDLLVSTWTVFLGWLVLGTAVYFLYGIHSSTAASDFSLLPSPTTPVPTSPKISLQPLPPPANNIVSHIVPSHRGHPRSQRRLAELDTVFIQH
ncbi:high affinity cationic amino acid transporter 1-like [Ornithodoros turicata]|uniref:high affinity cationic amino acid transporter 1-like n=1 Tax=Ornithodoros turicata TaxID=34597 RepID=UPI0031398CA0